MTGNVATKLHKHGPLAGLLIGADLQKLAFAQVAPTTSVEDLEMRQDDASFDISVPAVSVTWLELSLDMAGEFTSLDAS